MKGRKVGNGEIPTVIWYGERGILNAIALSLVVDTRSGLEHLLGVVEWGVETNKCSEIKFSYIDDVAVIVEPSFGRKHGFGDPDLMILFSDGKERKCVFIEAKTSGYLKSAMSNKIKGKGYYSSINGQLSLRYLLAKAEKTETQIKSNGRSLKKKGLLKILSTLGVCEIKEGNYYYIALTADKNNPIRNIDPDLLPEFDRDDFARLGWVNYEKIAGSPKLKDNNAFNYALKTMDVLPEEPEEYEE